MAKEIHLSKRVIEALTAPQKGRDEYRDAKAPGLTLYVSASSLKVFYYYGRVDGRPTRLKLGRYPALSVIGARREAARLAGEIAVGNNPADTRRLARAEATVGDLWTSYLEYHAKVRKRTWREDQRLYERHLRRWARRHLSTIHRADVETLHIRLKDTPYEANRVLTLLSGMYHRAADKVGYSGPNPVQGVEHFKEQSRGRYLLPDELRRFFEALAGEPNPRLRDFFLLCLLTGARRGNLLAMRWEHIDFQAGVWQIPGDEFKTGDPQTVYLSAAAIKVLHGRAEVDGDGEYVFPATRQGKRGCKHLQHPYRAWTALLERAGIKGLRIHDLRRTMGSWAAAGGATLPVLGKLLGHRDQNTTKVYARLPLNPVRVAVDAATAAMLAAAGQDEAPQLPASS